MKDNKKIMKIIMVILVAIIGIVGISFAFYNFDLTGDRSEVIAGTIYLNMDETGGFLTLNNVFPTTAEKARSRTDNVIEFTIEGKNTSTSKMINYQIAIDEGDDNNNYSIKIKPEHLRFDLIIMKDGVVYDEPVMNQSFSELNNTIILEDSVAPNTDNVSIDYQLRVWIDENVLLSDTDPNADYSAKDWKNTYASIKVSVYGDIGYTPFTQILASKIGTDGLVYVDDDGNLSIDGGREVRYSGSGKYCTYTDLNDSSVTYQLNVEGNTCPQACVLSEMLILNNSNELVSLGVDCAANGGSVLTANETTPNAGTVNNYVSFNGELWRIIGGFADENADGVSDLRVKIVKDSPLANDLYSSTEYTYNGTSYTLKNSYPLGCGYYHFNYSKSFGQTNGNDWTRAGLQYYLNDAANPNSYYNSISPTYQAMIEDMKFYLGNASGSSASDLYNEEREYNIHDGNNEFWSGKIGLMYPSDYAYATSPNYWNTAGDNWMLEYGGAQYNWMNDNTSIMEWTMSPSSRDSETVIVAGLMGYEGVSLEDLLPGAGLDGNVTNAHAVSPVLYLKSNVVATGGDGTEGNPYQLALQ